MKKEITFECIIDNHYGIYTAQVFAERFAEQSDLDAETVAILLAGPDHEDYWDCVDGAMEATVSGKNIYVGECGDWFLYDPAEIEQWEAENGVNYWDTI